MPNTITSYHTFSANTKARAAQMNTNLSNHRGTLVPINSDTASASDDTHDLGSDEHRWQYAYVRGIDLRTSTSTASLTIVGDTTNITGAFQFKIEGTTKAQIDTNGIRGSDVYSLPNTALQTSTAYPTMISTTITSNTDLTIPSWVTSVFIEAIGGGGGGGGGGTTGEGGGGGGAGAYSSGFVPYGAGTVLSITVGVGGSGGVGSTNSSGTNGSPGTATNVYVGGTLIFRAMNGLGGNGGVNGSGIGGYGGTSTSYAGGGRGGNTATAGTDGQGSHRNTGGSGGSAAGNYGGGGGGGACVSTGGNGGAGAAGTGDPGASPTYGSGGGGGGCGGGAIQRGGEGGTGGAGMVVVSWARPKGG